MSSWTKSKYAASARCVLYFSWMTLMVLYHSIYFPRQGGSISSLWRATTSRASGRRCSTTMRWKARCAMFRPKSHLISTAHHWRADCTTAPGGTRVSLCYPVQAAERGPRDGCRFIALSIQPYVLLIRFSYAIFLVIIGLTLHYV